MPHEGPPRKLVSSEKPDVVLEGEYIPRVANKPRAITFSRERPTDIIQVELETPPALSPTPAQSRSALKDAIDLYKGTAENVENADKKYLGRA